MRQPKTKLILILSILVAGIFVVILQARNFAEVDQGRSSASTTAAAPNGTPELQ